MRSFTAASDLSRFLTNFWDDALESEAHIFNIGNPANSTTVRQLAERVKALLNSDSEIVHMDGKERYGPMYMEAESFVKVPVLGAALDLGSTARVGLDEVILETASYYQMHEDYRQACKNSQVTKSFRVTYATV